MSDDDPNVLPPSSPEPVQTDMGSPPADPVLGRIGPSDAPQSNGAASGDPVVLPNPPTEAVEAEKPLTVEERLTRFEGWATRVGMVLQTLQVDLGNVCAAGNQNSATFFHAHTELRERVAVLSKHVDPSLPELVGLTPGSGPPPQSPNDQPIASGTLPDTGGQPAVSAAQASG